MDKIKLQDKSNILTDIANHLIVYGSFCQYNGLLKGKMGIAVFFYELYRRTNNSVYNDYAGDLIDEIYENMSLYTSPYFNDGLTGIAWGFEYLIRNKFVDADANEILTNIDRQIYERDVRRISDTGLDRGLKGIAHYIISRCANRKDSGIDKIYFSDLINSIKRQSANDKDLLILLDILMSITMGKYIPQNGLFVLRQMIEQVRFDEEKIFDDKRQLGILENGYAGIGLKLLDLLN